MKNEENKNQKQSNKLLMGLGFIAALVILILVFMNKKTDTVASKPAEEAEEATAQVGKPKIKIPETADSIEKPESTEEPETNAITAWLVHDFRDTNANWAGYSFKNLKVTPNGVELADGADEGVMETPSLLLKQPSNMVAPLWKQEVPRGASIKVECQISGDNQTWSDWYPMEDTGNDISPIYPNGDPNPNYGFVPGSYVSTGLSLAPYMKYRVTMSKSGGTTEYRLPDGSFPSTLRLAAVRVYHLDSSWGEGKIDNNFPPGPPKPGQQPQGAEGGEPSTAP